MANGPDDNQWVGCHTPNPTAAVRLFCFPYAGGSASSFRLWSAGLPDTVEVFPIQYPGRQNRFREAPLSRLSDLVAEVSDGLAPLLKPPYAFFGHSLGTLVAFELAHHLRAAGKTLPELLILSGRAAPHVVSDESPVHPLPDPEFLSEVLKRYNGIPRIVLEDAEFLKLLLPTLRADIAMVETYERREESPLDCRMTVYGGLSDAVQREDLAAWQSHTSGPFVLRMLPGDHFFFESERDTLLRAIGQDLLRCI